MWASLSPSFAPGGCLRCAAEQAPNPKYHPLAFFGAIIGFRMDTVRGMMKSRIQVSELLKRHCTPTFLTTHAMQLRALMLARQSANREIVVDCDLPWEGPNHLSVLAAPRPSRLLSCRPGATIQSRRHLESPWAKGEVPPSAVEHQPRCESSRPDDIVTARVSHDRGRACKQSVRRWPCPVPQSMAERLPHTFSLLLGLLIIIMPLHRWSFLHADARYDCWDSTVM